MANCVPMIPSANSAIDKMRRDEDGQKNTPPIKMLQDEPLDHIHGWLDVGVMNNTSGKTSSIELDLSVDRGTDLPGTGGQSAIGCRLDSSSPQNQATRTRSCPGEKCCCKSTGKSMLRLNRKGSGKGRSLSGEKHATQLLLFCIRLCGLCVGFSRKSIPQPSNSYF
jgi:hypothetical protein